MLNKIICFFIGHAVNNKEWQETQYQHEDFYYGTECKRCGDYVIREKKKDLPKKRTIVAGEFNEM